MPTPVQTFSNATGTVIRVTGITAGNTIVVAGVMNNNPSPTITSVTDNHSNSYTVIKQVANGIIFQSFFIAVLFVAPGGESYITVGGSIASGSGMIAREYAIADLTSLDTSAINAYGPSSPTTTITSGATPITTTANETVVGFSFISLTASLITAGSGYGNFASNGQTTNATFIEDKSVSSTGAQTATFTDSGGGASVYYAAVATFTTGGIYIAPSSTIPPSSNPVHPGNNILNLARFFQPPWDTTSAQTNRVIYAKGNITVITQKIINAVANIATTTLKTLTGVSRIAITSLKTITGVANINTTSTLTPIIGGANSGPSNSVTNSITPFNAGNGSWSGTDRNRAVPFPVAGTLSNFQFEAGTAPGGVASWALAFAKNGTAGALSLTITGSQTIVTNYVNTMSVAAGDRISLQSTPTGSPTSMGNCTWTALFTPSGAGSAVIVGNQNTSTAGTVYAAPFMSQLSQSTPANAGLPIPTSGTINNLYITLGTATGVGNTSTYTVFKNGIATGIIATITNANNGSDTTDVIKVAQGDLLCIEQKNTAGTPAATVFSFGMEFDPDIAGEAVIMGGPSTGPSATVTNFNSLTGQAGWAASESLAKQQLSQSVAVKKLTLNAISSPGSTKSFAITLRDNTTSTTLTATLSGSNTTATDNTHIAYVGLGDLLDMQSAPTNTPTSSMIGYGVVMIVAATTLKTITGVTRITQIVLKTITGVGRISVTTLKTITGVARITGVSQKAITGIARITQIVQKTITGVSRITATALKTIQGVARISRAAIQTITGVARLTGVTLQTITGIARITATTLRSITGVARITIITQKTLLGVARITAATTQTITGLAKIFVNNIGDQDIFGKARITGKTLKTITGVARIGLITKRNITGLARIIGSVNKTLTGLARILVTIATAQFITGVARLTGITQHDIIGKASIRGSGRQDITGVAHIIATIPFNDGFIVYSFSKSIKASSGDRSLQIYQPHRSIQADK